MKKIYSIILLISFLIGVFQPVMPMVEYHLLYGDIMESIFNSKVNTNSLCDDEIYSEDFSSEECNCNREMNRQMLDLDYYPVPLVYSLAPGSAILPIYSELFILLSEDEKITFSKCNVPPPKHG